MQEEARIWDKDFPWTDSAITWSRDLGLGQSFHLPELLSHLQSEDSNNPHLTGSP